MQFRHGASNINTICTFSMQNKPVAQFNGDMIKVLQAQGRDPAQELNGMLRNALAQHGVNLTEEYINDIDSVVNQYVEIMLRN